MAHFARIENNVVIEVLVVPNDQEHRGQEYLADDLGLGGTWVQTSYNTYHGKHKFGGAPLRKNYASVGYVYDVERDAFIPPKPDENIFESEWNEEACAWLIVRLKLFRVQ